MRFFDKRNKAKHSDRNLSSTKTSNVLKDIDDALDRLKIARSNVLELKQKDLRV